MTDLTHLYKEVDALDPGGLDQLNAYIQQRRRRFWWVVSSENLDVIDDVMWPVHEDIENMSDDEINDVIDEVIQEVRWQRKFANSQAQLTQLADEALEEFCSGDTQALNPDTL
jgi:hypothetical protein